MLGSGQERPRTVLVRGTLEKSNGAAGILATGNPFSAAPATFGALLVSLETFAYLVALSGLPSMAGVCSAKGTSMQVRW